MTAFNVHVRPMTYETLWCNFVTQQQLQLGRATTPNAAATKRATNTSSSDTDDDVIIGGMLKQNRKEQTS